MDAPVAAPIRFDNSYARLPERFYARQAPEAWPEPKLLALNLPLAERLGLDAEFLRGEGGLGMLSGAALPEGAEPIAMAYAGHQFGGWVPQLGDGRAVLVGEVEAPDGARFDVQLKGAGRTPWSRGGDGRAGLGPVLREYIVSEAMAALGVPTTRALSAALTGEPVMRETPQPGAVLTRVARGHVRVGTFQYFYARQDLEALRMLAEYAARRWHPEALEAELPALGLLRAAVRGQARLVARWMGLGFIHGVMNTDNMSLACETIDYGPCAFMEAYHPDTVYSSIDRFGRYAYANQPRIAQWNLAQLAQTLLPLMAETPEDAVPDAQAAIDEFPDLYAAEWLSVFRAKLGLERALPEDDRLAEDLLSAMAAGKADFTATFRALCALPLEGGTETDGAARDRFADPAAFDLWAVRWRDRLAKEPRGDAARRAAMEAANPAFIPRNHLVEEALDKAAREGDLGPFAELMEVLARPFEEQPGRERYAEPARPEEAVTATFCGT
jgi:uncharacterized protein YdiU (UPF0061 family)